MEEVDTRTKMPHLGRERLVVKIEQEQDSYLECHMEPGGAWLSKTLPVEEQTDFRDEGWELDVGIKKDPESEETELYLEFEDTQLTHNEGLADGDQSEKGDRRGDEVPVSGFEMKTELEPEEPELGLETSPQMQPSPSRPESQGDTSAPIRRGHQYRCHICSAEYGDVIQLTMHAKSHRRSKGQSSKAKSLNVKSVKVKSSNFKSSKVRKCRSCCKVLFHSLKKTQKIDLCEKCSDIQTGSRQNDDVLKEDGAMTNNESRSCSIAQPADTKTLLVRDVKRVTQTFTCWLCGQIFVSADGLEKHRMKSHTVKKKFLCKVCKKKCPDQSALDLHVKDVHIVAKPFLCHICSKSFYQKYHLKEHAVIHSREKSFCCNHCDQKFTHRRTLSRHKKKCSVDSQEGLPEPSCDNIHACCHCSDIFTDRVELTDHKRERHKDMLHICELCDARFTEKSSLAMHYKVHSGIKPHMCDYCGKRFSRGHHLKIHQRLHTGENPYKCDECSETFTRNDRFKSHWQRIHVEGRKVKSYHKVWADEDCRCVCKVEGCGKRFGHSSQLKRHRQKVHEQQAM